MPVLWLTVAETLTRLIHTLFFRVAMKCGTETVLRPCVQMWGKFLGELVSRAV